MDSFLQLVKRFELDVQSMAICHDADVRLRIDSKVEELRHTIVLFHQLRNRRTTISKLPSELLGLIFYYVRDISVSECGAAAHLSWIPRISHVCSLWRELALSMPYLWASISVTSVGRRWLPEMVRRSCLANLSISGNYDGYNFVRNMQSVLDEDVLQRLETLELTNVDSACLHAVFPSLPSSEADANISCFKFSRRFSSLRKLAISARGRLTDPFVLCDASLDAPLLQHLELTKCAVQWDAKFFGRLMRLSINNPIATLSSPTTLLHALAAVSETLTSLTLVRALSAIPLSKDLFLDVNHSDVPVPALVNLPILQTLCVNESSINVDQILSFINIITTTPKTEIQIGISSADDQRGKEYSYNAFSRIMTRIPEFLSRSSWTASFEGIRRENTVFSGRWPFTTIGRNERTEISALSLDYSTSWQRSRFELGLASSINVNSHLGRLGSGDHYPLNFNLSFEWVKPRGAVHNSTCDTSTLLALQAFDTFDLAGLQQLRCQGINMPTEAWRRALCSLENLEEIQFFHLPGGENNFFSGSLASGAPKLTHSVEQFSRALYRDDGDDEEFRHKIGSPTHLFCRQYHSYGHMPQPAPALRFVTLQQQDSLENFAILQDALCRRAREGSSQFGVLIWK